MSDNISGNLGALYLYGEAQRKSQDAQFQSDSRAREAQNKNNELEELNRKNSELNDELEGEISILKKQKKHLLTEFAKERDYRNELVDMVDEANRKNKKLEEENAKYKKLLCKPMAEIAKENENFRETYEKQMELMATWMISQKAFKELALQFGFEKGLTSEEVIDKSRDVILDVLDDKNDPNHGTNASDSPEIKERQAKLKNDLSEKIKSARGKNK